MGSSHTGYSIPMSVELGSWKRTSIRVTDSTARRLLGELYAQLAGEGDREEGECVPLGNPPKPDRALRGRLGQDEKPTGRLRARRRDGMTEWPGLRYTIAGVVPAPRWASGIGFVSGSKASTRNISPHLGPDFAVAPQSARRPDRERLRRVGPAFAERLSQVGLVGGAETLHGDAVSRTASTRCWLP